MSDISIEATAWNITTRGDARACYEVTLGDHATQTTTVIVTAETLAEVGATPDEEQEALAAVDHVARDTIVRLSTTGRIQPELVLTPTDLRSMRSNSDLGRRAQTDG